MNKLTLPIAVVALCLTTFATHTAAAQAAPFPAPLSILPQSAPVVAGHSQQFRAEFSDPAGQVTNWEVNGVVGGTSTLGTVTASGLYTAPAQAPATAVTVSAVSSTLTASAPVVVVNTPGGSVYYVAKTGKDTNPGTSALPWLTISHAAASVRAGDTVLIHAGVYKEQVKMKASGSAQAGFITFQNYPGEVATVDGTGLSPGGQSGLIDIENVSFLIVRGLEIRNFKTASAAQVPIGVFVTGAGSCLEILGNHIHGITTYVKNASGNALGFAAYGSSGSASLNNLIVSGNEIDHLVTGSSESTTLNGNVQYFQVTNNYVHDDNNIGIDAIGFEHVSSNPSTDQARDGLIAGNEIAKITSASNPAYTDKSADGLYVDGGTRIMIEGNRVHQADLGLELASETPGRVTSDVVARDNVIYGCSVAGITIGGYDGSVGGTDHCLIVNNTLYNNDTGQTGSGEFQIQYHATNNVFENNAVYANGQGLFLNAFVKSSVPPAVVDHNLYYAPGSGANGVQWTWRGTTYTDLPTYRTKTGNDHASPFADPQFKSLTVPDFHIASTSPAVNAGLLLGSAEIGAFDFVGAPRVQNGAADIGALEH